jgi:hypothetical protein
MDLIADNPDRFNRGVIRPNDPDWQESMREDVSRFINQFDYRTLTNADIAEAFGYPELAVGEG